MTIVSVRGRRAMVIKYPAISSMTIFGQSLWPKRTSARSEAHQAKKKTAAELNK